MSQDAIKRALGGHELAPARQHALGELERLGLAERSVGEAEQKGGRQPVEWRATKPDEPFDEPTEAPRHNQAGMRDAVDAVTGPSGADSISETGQNRGMELPHHGYAVAGSASVTTSVTASSDKQGLVGSARDQNGAKEGGFRINRLSHHEADGTDARHSPIVPPTTNHNDPGIAPLDGHDEARRVPRVHQNVNTPSDDLGWLRDFPSCPQAGTRHTHQALPGGFRPFCFDASVAQPSPPWVERRRQAKRARLKAGLQARPQRRASAAKTTREAHDRDSRHLSWQ
jgi:hypothetical protein